MSFETSTASYRDAIFGANDEFVDETLDVAKIYAYNETKIAAGGNVEPDAFENPTSADGVRFCYVGEKEVVRLRFAALTAETTGAPAILRERRNAFLARKRVSAFSRSFGSVAASVRWATYLQSGGSSGLSRSGKERRG